MPLGTDRDRLADYVRARRAELRLERDVVATRMGMVGKTVERIENSFAVRADTYAKLEIALGWTPGSVRSILAGREPIPADPAQESPAVDPARLAVREMADCILQGKDVGPLAKYWSGRLADPDDIWGLIDEARRLAREEDTDRDESPSGA